MDVLVLALILATLIERFIQMVLKPAMPQVAPFAAYVGILLGIALAVIFNVDLFAALGLHSVYPLAGAIASGFVLGGGSHYLNDSISLIRGDGAGGVPAAK